MAYLDLLSKIGPSPKEQEEKLEEAKKEKEKEIEAGAKEEIKELQGRVKELKADPNKTYNKPYEGFTCECEEKPVKYQKVKDPKDEWEEKVSDVALSLMENAQDESEAIHGYSKLIHEIKELQQCCMQAIKHMSKKLEMREGEATSDIKSKIEHHKKVFDWCTKEIERSNEKIRDELNHNTLLLAEYTEFTGLTPMPDDIKDAVKVLGSAPASSDSKA